VKVPIGLDCHQIRLLEGSPTSNLRYISPSRFQNHNTYHWYYHALLRTYTADISGKMDMRADRLEQQAMILHHSYTAFSNSWP